MKYILTLLVMLMIALSAFAHPASEITATYNADTKTLAVSFKHAVSDPVKHYIKDIRVSLNGATIITQLNSAQDSATGGDLLYRIPNLKKNDILDITLNCSKAGTKSTQMKLR